MNFAWSVHAVEGALDPHERRSLRIQATGLVGMLAAGGILASTSLRVPLICPLRALTGIPCPLCGMTTGVVATLQGDLAPAVGANLFSPIVVPGALVALAERLRRLKNRGPFRRWSWTKGRKRLAITALGASVAISWIFELFRFNVL